MAFAYTLLFIEAVFWFYAIHFFVFCNPKYCVYMFYTSDFYHSMSLCPVSVAMDIHYEKLASPPVGGVPVSHAH